MVFMVEFFFKVDFEKNQQTTTKSWQNTQRALTFMLFLLISGEMDHVPEVAFFMVGPIEEVISKAERLAEEQS